MTKLQTASSKSRAVGRSENKEGGGGGQCVLKWGFMRTFPGNQDGTLK